jgi:hypothetical protein
MPQSLILEFVRQFLRWASVYLLTVGLPEWAANFVQNPEFVQYVTVSLMLGMSETGWLVVKLKQLKTWLSSLGDEET